MMMKNEKVSEAFDFYYEYLYLLLVEIWLTS